TYPYASGAEPVRGAIRIALGEPPGIKALRRWTSAERAFITIPGLVRSVEGLDQARRVPGIRDLFLRAGPGKRLSFPENNVSKAGNVISAGPDRENAIGAAEKAARTVLIRLAAPDSETEAFLSGPPGPGSPDSAPLFPPPAYTAGPALLSELSALPETRNAFNTPGLDSRRETPAVYAVPFPAFTESNLRDYQGRTPAETLDAIRALTGLALPPAPDNRRNASYAAAPATESGTVVLGREFWTALIRGGYQGAGYYIDRLLGAAAANAPGETP
ncbi:MAG: hypothetical protein LBD09_07180, partial [Treponema sp.]|nr:hypothetical protein [Treponema sp.]